MTNIVFIDQTAVVTELPQQPVFNQFRKLAKELLHADFEGKVVFDLLISKGTSARFVEAYFDGKEIVRSSMKLTSSEELSLEIVKRQSQFFAQNARILKTSMLSNMEIEMLLNPDYQQSLSDPR